MTWFPGHQHSEASLLDGLSKPEQIAERLVECGYAGGALTDHGTLSGIPSFLKAFKNACKCGHQKSLHEGGTCSKCGCGCFEAAGLKAIPGCEFYISSNDACDRSKENGRLSHLCVLAKGPAGWKNLMRASSRSYQPDVFYRKPRLDLDLLAQFAQDQFIVFSGHMGSGLADCIFTDPHQAYDCETEAEAKALAHKDWPRRVFDLIERYQALFGRDNFYVEIQLIDHENLPASAVVAEGLRWAARRREVPCVATADSHYCRKEDAPDQRLLLATAMDVSLKEIQRKLQYGEEVGLSTFFKSNNYHIPSLDEMRGLHTPEELKNACEIGERCEPVDVSGSPLLPQFPCPDGLTPDSYLKKLCVGGWKRLIPQALKRGGKPETAYRDRVRMELEVLTEANLSSYFLIVEDFVRYANSKGWMTGKGRGSAAGCLVSYLLGITRDVDPIRYELFFERFYSAARKGSLPDIDVDFPKFARGHVIEYLREKYGRDRVAQMATFTRMQGRGAIKDVLRAHERCSFEEMNAITAFIPDEAEIADQLQDMREETGEASIIRWSLLHHSEQLRPYAFYRNDGELDGPYALDFAQAMRVEGTKRNMSKHASGIIICSEPLADVAPMVFDRSSGEQIVGLDMRDCESVGLVKFDVLGVTVLDRCLFAQSIVRTGRITIPGV